LHFAKDEWAYIASERFLMHRRRTVVRGMRGTYLLRPRALVKLVTNAGNGFAAVGDAEFPFLDVRDHYAGIPIHRRPVSLVLICVLLTQNATFAVAVLMSPLDDMGSRPIAPTLAFPLSTLLRQLVIFVHAHLVLHAV